MTGLLRPDEPFVAVNPAIARAVGMTCATVLGHIAYAETSEGATITTEDIAKAVGCSIATVKRATTKLREVGLLTARRAEPWKATLVYHVEWLHPIVTGQHESVTLPLSGVAECAPREEQSAPLLLSEGKTTTTLPADAGEGVPAMSVPASYQEPLLPTVGLTLVTEETGPAKTAQTLVARWVDGYRVSNHRSDPPGPVTKRVAGQMRNLAKACVSHEDWVAAYAVSYQAGVQGRFDPVQLMAARPRTARTTNAFASPELGAPAGAAAALAAMSGQRVLG